MLEQNKNLLNSFTSLRLLTESNNILEDGMLVIHANERNLPGHGRKYNTSAASEVAALILGRNK